MWVKFAAFFVLYSVYGLWATGCVGWFWWLVLTGIASVVMLVQTATRVPPRTPIYAIFINKMFFAVWVFCQMAVWTVADEYTWWGATLVCWLGNVGWFIVLYLTYLGANQLSAQTEGFWDTCDSGRRGGVDMAVPGSPPSIPSAPSMPSGPPPGVAPVRTRLD